MNTYKVKYKYTELFGKTGTTDVLGCITVSADTISKAEDVAKESVFDNLNEVDWKAISITLTKTPSGRPRSLDNFVLKEAAELVVRNQYATVNYLCRHLGIGNARANRIMDRMEELGIVGPFHGSKPREVLVKSVDKALAGILK